MKNNYKELRCKHCGRKLLHYKNNIDIQVKCNKCKKIIDVKIFNNDIKYNLGGLIK